MSQGGQSYTFGAFAVNLAAGTSAAITATAPASLTIQGGYYLHGCLTNARGQVLSESHSSFFLSTSPLALTLGTDQPAYKPGQTVTVTGQVHNTGIEPIGPETLTLSQNDTPFYTETVSLPASASHDFIVVTTAPSAAGQFTLTVQISTTQVVAAVSVAEPEIDMTLDAPAVVMPGTFVASLQLANNGQVPAALSLNFHGQPYVFSLRPGDLAIYTRTLAITQTTDLTAQLSGDITRTLTHTVHFSAAPNMTLTPADPQHEGDVEIPYTLVNPGMVDLVAEVTFDLAEATPLAMSKIGAGDDVHILRSDLPALQRAGVAWLAPQWFGANDTVITRTHTLPAGGTVTDTLVINLSRGRYPVEATLRVDESYNPGLFSHSQSDFWQETEALTLTVQGDNDLRIAAGGAPTVTVVITNVGWNAFTGTLRAVGRREEVFSIHEQPIVVATGSSRSYTATVNTADQSPGAYNIALELWAENGVQVASTSLTGSIPGPDWVVTQRPAQTNLLSNQVVTLTFGVQNQGDAPDLAVFHLKLGDLEDETQKQWVAAGATALFTFTTYLPLDMPSMDVLATYAVTSTLDPVGDSGQQLFHVDGISLTVQASTDRPYYQEGDPVTVLLDITNAGTRNTGGLTALVAFSGITRTQTFSLTPGAQISLTFSYTATFLGDRKIFYGIYGEQSDRGAYLNTLYLYRQNPEATLNLDKEVYLPGQAVQATLVTTMTQGTLNAFVFGNTYTLTIGVDTGFSFVVPANAERGSHALYYVVHGCDCSADGREQVTWFDVAAPWIRVIESRLSEGPYLRGEVVSATLTVAADAAQDVATQTWIGYPDGSEGQTYRQTVSLPHPWITRW